MNAEQTKSRAAAAKPEYVEVVFVDDHNYEGNDRKKGEKVQVRKSDLADLKAAKAVA